MILEKVCNFKITYRWRYQMDLITIDKIKTIKEVTLEAIEFIFFMAMQVGWASGKTFSSKAPLLPGYKVIPFDYYNFHVIDAYSIPHSGKSEGFTKIRFQNFPVWSMSYGGSYPKEVIPFLKLALMENYSKKIFNGGRGPSTFRHSEFPQLTYENNLSFCYNDLKGLKKHEVYEYISTPGRGSIGTHWYHGMSLI